MVCRRFEMEGMKLIDGEMTPDEQEKYEAHLSDCEDCRRELKEMGRIVEMTNELRIKAPDEEFWVTYWNSLSRRMERGVGFVLMIVGIIAVLCIGIVKAVTSPEFFTFKGLSIAVILVGLVIVFLSVVRERYHESKDDPYKGIRQ